MQDMLIEEVEIKMIKVKVSDEAVRRRDLLQSAGKCLGCESPLGDKPPRRGLCPACYQAMLRATIARKVTKTELIREGKMLDRGRRGRVTGNKFTRELAGR